jgi:hypothetical protein
VHNNIHRIADVGLNRAIGKVHTALPYRFTRSLSDPVSS